jgi:histidinol-phosphatase (PHP family)
MLTDYHVHLRPDDPAATPADYFTRANFELYRAAASERGISELGVSEHVYRFHQALEVWSHPYWVANARDDLDHYCEFIRSETDLRLGIEADFVAGREERMADLLAGRDFDYVIGSVHFIQDVAVDMDPYSVWNTSQSPEEIWLRYFQTLGQAARSGLFDVIAHPDLVKIWGAERPLPSGDLRRYYEPAIEGIADSGVAVEVSTAGLRKRVAEIYPAPAFLEMCLAVGAPVALSSDAHRPEDVGADYDRAIDYLGGLGIEQVCVFDHRRRRVEPLAAVEDRDRIPEGAGGKTSDLPGGSSA